MRPSVKGNRSPRAALASAVTAFALACSLLAPQASLAEISITVSGSWTEFVDYADLAGGAGTNLTGTFTSASNAVMVTVSGALNKTDAWEVSVKRIDTGWNPALAILARRTSNGKGQGSVSGGTNFVQVTETDSPFFTGNGNIKDIQVQLSLTNMSLSVQPASYMTTIQFTVIDTP